MKNKEMLYFIGRSLAVDRVMERRDEIIQIISKNQFDWERFVYLASNHRVLQLIYSKWRAANLLKFMPQDLEEHIHEVYCLNQERNLAIIEQLDDVTQCLNQANISPVYLKGAANLIDQLYLNIGDRLLVDIDLLVSQNEISDAVAMLKANGYTNYTGKKCVASPKHYPRLTKQDLGADVEVHFLAVSPEYSDNFNYETIKQNWKGVEAHPYCYVLSDEDKLRLNFIHAHLNNGGYRKRLLSLRDLYDVLVIGDRINLKEVIPTLGYEREADTYFLMVKELFGLSDDFFTPKSRISFFYKRQFDFFLDHIFLFRVNRYLRNLLVNIDVK